jgi:hypothetical protein
VPPWQAFTIYGPLGLIFFLAVLFVRMVFDKMSKDRDGERQYSMETEKDFRERIVPLLAQVQQTTAEAVKLLSEIRTEQQVDRQLERELDRRTRES